MLASFHKKTNNAKHYHLHRINLFWSKHYVTDLPCTMDILILPVVDDWLCPVILAILHWQLLSNTHTYRLIWTSWYTNLLDILISLSISILWYDSPVFGPFGRTANFILLVCQPTWSFWYDSQLGLLVWKPTYSFSMTANLVLLVWQPTWSI